MFAYVKYEDKYKAILPISLVKTFSPKSEEDFDRAKKLQAFWRSEDGPALKQKFKKKKRLEAAHILQESIIARSEEEAQCQQSEEPNGENVFVVELQKIIEKKEKENKNLKKQLREANALNGRLTRALLDKIEVARATAERQERQVIAEFTLPSSLDAGTGLPKEMVEDVRDADMDGDATCLLPGSVVSDCSASIGIEVTHLEDYNGSFAPCAAEAAKRSLTGQECRSISTDHVKLQATPEKVDMMKGSRGVAEQLGYCPGSCLIRRSLEKDRLFKANKEHTESEKLKRRMSKRHNLSQEYLLPRTIVIWLNTEVSHF
ncbi:hypothetical protein MTO96_018368 [Rhipicephalus appendiculatus]